MLKINLIFQKQKTQYLLMILKIEYSLIRGLDQTVNELRIMNFQH